MAVHEHDVGGDIDALDQLSLDQRQYLAYFRAIMQELDNQTRDTLDRFKGGDDELRSSAADFQQAFQMTNDGFSKIINAVENTRDSYADTRSYLRTLFE
ncbi:hypothetical protein KGD82_12125 [Nocardiopsis eucommiae]|uniref:Uncharacterized protein n=1 Tax=Nocardiopsis eucommiae TaxID=2831970 RepID=A0A975QM31_9ACTN|nr:hypothetical protein KGD82_12125 [Nocardiopsis eucommiae]